MEQHRDGDESCKSCLSVYSVTYRDYPEKDRGKFHCEVCGTLVRECKGCRDWTFTLRARGPDRES